MIAIMKKPARSLGVVVGGVLLCLLQGAAFTGGCGSKDDNTTAASGAGGAGQPQQISLKGAVQKGPFVLGSSITVSPLDAKGNPTGQAFLTQTTNDKGEFSVDFAASGQVSIQGEGFYFNEVAGSLSGAALTLRALYVIEKAGPQQAYLNLITHLTYLRVRKLVADGKSFGDAIKQAEKELRDEMAITLPAFDPGAQGLQMNILGGDSPANAYLLAASAVLVQAATLQGPVDAGLQELANAITTDLEEDGKLSMTNKSRVAAGLLALDSKAVMANLATRLDELGSNAKVPDIDKILDQDGDGLTNDKDNCRRVANLDQADEGDSDGVGDVCDNCPDVANSDQKVTDGSNNSFGDACDPCRLDSGNCDCNTTTGCSPSGKCSMAKLSCVTFGKGVQGDVCKFTAGGDDCAMGYECVPPLSDASPTAGICHLLCGNNANAVNCPQGTSCANLLALKASKTLNVCAPTCAPKSPTCPKDQSCYWQAAVSNGDASKHVCAYDYSGTSGSVSTPCPDYTVANGCDAGFVCTKPASKCGLACDPNLANTCLNGDTCHGFFDNSIGYCAPP